MVDGAGNRYEVIGCGNRYVNVKKLGDKNWTGLVPVKELWPEAGWGE